MNQWKVCKSYFIFFFKNRKILQKILFFLSVDEEEMKILTLEPQIEPDNHDPVFINELKLSEFKQILAKSNISSEISGGVLWCCNGSMVIRRVRIFNIINHKSYIL